MPPLDRGIILNLELNNNDSQYMDAWQDSHETTFGSNLYIISGIIYNSVSSNNKRDHHAIGIDKSDEQPPGIKTLPNHIRYIFMFVVFYLLNSAVTLCYSNGQMYSHVSFCSFVISTKGNLYINYKIRIHTSSTWYTIQNHSLHMKWTSEVVNPRVITFRGLTTWSSPHVKVIYFWSYWDYSFVCFVL